MVPLVIPLSRNICSTSVKKLLHSSALPVRGNTFQICKRKSHVKCCVNSELGEEQQTMTLEGGTPWGNPTNAITVMFLDLMCGTIVTARVPHGEYPYARRMERLKSTSSMSNTVVWLAQSSLQSPLHKPLSLQGSLVFLDVHQPI